MKNPKHLLFPGSAQEDVRLLFSALEFNLKTRWMKQEKEIWKCIISEKSFVVSKSIKNPQQDRKNTPGQLCYTPIKRNLFLITHQSTQACSKA